MIEYIFKAPVPGTSPTAPKKPPQALYVPPGRKSADVQKPDLKDLQVPIKFESSKKISKAKNNSRHEIRKFTHLFFDETS